MTGSTPVRGRGAKSSAISAAEPRRKAYGEAIIRPTRTGTSRWSRPSWASSIRSSGSGRSSAGRQRPSSPRLTCLRRARPASMRSSLVGSEVRSTPVMATSRPVRSVGPHLARPPRPCGQPRPSNRRSATLPAGAPRARGRGSRPPLSHRWSRLPAMMKRSHAVIGAAAGVAVAHATGASMLAGGIVAALAGLLPDVDHPHAAVGRLLPRWWHRLTPGHRGPTHSLVWCLGLAVLVYAGGSLAGGAPAAPLLALAVLAGSLSHVLADGLTVAGVPLWWPFRRRRAVFLGALAFRTRSWAEALVVGGVVAGVGWWVAG